MDKILTFYEKVRQNWQIDLIFCSFDWVRERDFVLANLPRSLLAANNIAVLTYQTHYHFVCIPPFCNLLLYYLNAKHNFDSRQLRDQTHHGRMTVRKSMQGRSARLWLHAGGCVLWKGIKTPPSTQFAVVLYFLQMNNRQYKMIYNTSTKKSSKLISSPLACQHTFSRL